MAEQLRTLEVSIDIAAPVASVWRVVADVRRTGEWSPECRRVIPIGGRVRRGSWLLGLNRRGRTRWPTLSRVTRFDPEREISWRVDTNGAHWGYTLRESAAGCELTSTRRTPNGVGAFASWFTRTFLGGQTSHDEELEAGIRASLERIRTLAEA
jgi:uncharacterized protein YndB with AHSA1/START domain